MAELVDAIDSKFIVFYRRVGSSPTTGIVYLELKKIFLINKFNYYINKIFLLELRVISFFLRLIKSLILARLEGLEPVLYMLACSNLKN